MTPHRGEVWQVDLGLPVGHEQGKTRPALVLSDEMINRGPSGLVVIVPITGTRRNVPLHVNVPRGEGGLTKDSCILCDQVRSVSIRRLLHRYERVSPAVMAAVEDKVKIVLGIR